VKSFGIGAGERIVPMALILAGLVVAVWLPSLDSPFQFDDWNVIVRDSRVASLAAWWQSMPALRPLLKLEYALGHELGGAPLLYRAVNVAVHATNVMLVFALVRRLARRMRLADPAGATRVGAFTAIVFALHPVQTESVTYISGGSQALATLFALLTLMTFTRLLDARGHAWRQFGWLGLSLLSLVAALAARETTAVVPVACALWWAAESGPRGLRDDGAAPWIALALLLAVTIAAAVAAWWSTAYPYLLQTSLGVRSPWRNLLAQGDAIAWLLGQLLRWNDLNADPALAPDTALSAANLARAVVLLALIGVAVWQWRSRRWLAFGVLWFFLWLAPTHSLIARLDLANERHLYLALVGPAWLLAIGLSRLRTQGLVIAALLATALTFATAQRNRVYADEVTFWQDVVAKSPHNARAANNLGMALAAACQPLAAARAFDDAARKAPDDPRAGINAALLERGALPGVPPACVTAPSAPR
jgi:protein O-mannosyl-transferase